MEGSGTRDCVDDERGSWDDMPTNGDLFSMFCVSLLDGCRGGRGGGFPLELAPC